MDTSGNNRVLKVFLFLMISGKRGQNEPMSLRFNSAEFFDFPHAFQSQRWQHFDVIRMSKGPPVLEILRKSRQKRVQN